MNKGVGYGIATYVLWGLLPVYWKCLHRVPALQLVSHRIVWSCLFLIGVVLLSGQARALRRAWLTPSIRYLYLLASLLIGINWTFYIWAVNAGLMVEASLGYFINPLLNVLLGVLFFRERLRVWQWISLGVALSGVIYLTVVYGRLPWVALVLAVSFACYGAVKKVAPLGAVQGLTLETAILVLPALIYLGYEEVVGQGAFLHGGAEETVLLVGAGLMTTAPLLLFAAAVQRIPLSLMGILQYLSPTLQFLLGVLVYRELITVQRLVGFGLVWAALVIFGIDGMRARQGTKYKRA